MKAKIYKITVSSGTMEAIHGFSREIIEIYIPAMSVVLNTEEGFNCFIDDANDRHKNATYLGEIEVPEHVIDIVQQYVEITAIAAEEIPKWFDSNEEVKKRRGRK